MELIFTMAVVAILAAIATPNMRSFILNNRLTSTSNELLRSLQTARTEAPRRQKNVVLCMSANTTTTPTCSTTNPDGWIVFEDPDNDWKYGSSEELIETHTFDSTKMKILFDSDAMSFASTGFPNAIGGTNITAMVLCDSRGINDAGGGTTGLSLARGIAFSKTGRPHVTREVTNASTGMGIKQLQTITGGSCS